MKPSLNFAFFGSSLLSAYWNGAATYYRGLIAALHARGHRITFYEPDAFQRQQHRDIPTPPYANVVVYEPTEAAAERCLNDARHADVIIKTSGVGVLDTYLEAAVLHLKASRNVVCFWDVDAPATLDRVHKDLTDPFLSLIPQYDFVFTYGGGDPVVRAYAALRAKLCLPIYNALDPSTHHPVPPDRRFTCDLAFLGNRLPDREARVEEFFLRCAQLLPDKSFLLGGNGWQDKPLPRNVKYLGHVYTRDHNALNCTPLAVLNISRESMARYGFSPATRVFEAAGAGACLITDYWEGIESFLEPDKHILVAKSGDDVAHLLRTLTPDQATRLGQAALAHVRAHHTYAHRATLVEQTLLNALAPTLPLPLSERAEVRGRTLDDQQLSSAKPVTDDNLTFHVSRFTSSPPSSLRRSVASSLDILFLGLTLTSSWGNGHATTYRSLLRALHRRGHRLTFLEHDKPWYAHNRDMPQPSFCRTELYASLDDLKTRFADDVRTADLVIVGSYVPHGVEVGQWVTSIAQGPTAFYDIDTPVTLAKLRNGDCEYLSPDLIPRYDLYLSFTGGPTLRYLEDHYHAPMARPLYCSFDPDLYYPEPQPPQWDLGYLGTYSPDRQPTLEQLLLTPARTCPVAKFIVAGPQYPDAIDWPRNVERVHHVEPRDHRRFYCQQRFTLNITRADMIQAGYSPSVRLFEAAACGTPIISDTWPGLSDFFTPDEEILLANSPHDILHLLHHYPEDQRRRLAARARRRVLSEHTSSHRAAQLESYALSLLHPTPTP